MRGKMIAIWERGGESGFWLRNVAHQSAFSKLSMQVEICHSLVKPVEVWDGEKVSLSHETENLAKRYPLIRVIRFIRMILGMQILYGLTDLTDLRIKVIKQEGLNGKKISSCNNVN